MNSRKHSPPFTILHLYPLPNFPSPLTYQSYQIISVSGIHPLSWHSRRPCHFILQRRDTNGHFPCNKARGQCCSFASTTAAPAFRTWQNGTCSFSYTWFVGKKTCITSETLKMHALSENYCLRLHKFISIQNHLKQPAGRTIIAELHCLSIEPVLSSQNFITYDCKLSNESSTGHQRCFVVWLGVLFFCTVVISSSLFPINSLSASRPFEWWNKRHDLCSNFLTQLWMYIYDALCTSHLIWNHVRVPNSIFTVVLCHSTCSPSFAFAGTHIRTTLSRLQVLRPQTVIPWPFTSIHLALLWWHDMTTSSQHLEGFRKCNCNDATPICLKSSQTFVFLWKSQGQSMWWCLHELNHPTKILN